MLSRRSRTILALAASAALLSGCAEYANHWDTVTFRAGNSLDANEGIHTVQPFPRAAWRTHINSDGKVVYKAVTDYQKGKNSLSSTSGASSGGQTITSVK